MHEKINPGNELMHDSCPKKYYSNSVIVSGMLPSILAFLVVAALVSFFLHKVMDLTVILIVVGVLFVLMFIGMFSLFRGMCKRLSETKISVCENGIEGVVCLGQMNSTFCVGYDEISKVQTGTDRIVITVSYGTLNLLVHEPEQLADLIREKAELNSEVDDI